MADLDRFKKIWNTLDDPSFKVNVSNKTEM